MENYNVDGLKFYSELMGEANFHNIIGNERVAKHKQELAGAAVIGYDLKDKLHKEAKKIDRNGKYYDDILDKFPHMYIDTLYPDY